MALLPLVAFAATTPPPPPVAGAVAIPGPGLLNRFLALRVAGLAVGLTLFFKGYFNPGITVTGAAVLSYPFNCIYILFLLGLNFMGLSVF